MAGKKQTTFKPDFNASKCGKHETFATIYDSMMKHEKFKNLSLAAKFLYIACRNQHTSRLGRECLYNHAKEHNITYPNNAFVFPAKHQKEYGFNDRSNVRRWMKELIEAGFIEIYENNKHRWKVNVYVFISKWKEE